MDYIKFDGISSVELIILLGIIVAIVFIFLEPRFSNKKLVNKNEHGSSKFADMKEINKTFKKESVTGSNSIGFPVWYEKKNGKFESVYLDDKSPHYLLIGSTGSGKSVTVVLNECLMFATANIKHSVVVTDPKGEIFRATSKVFSDNGYDVVTIDFRNPTKSKRINIMQPIIDEWKEHCKYNKTMLFLFSHFVKTNKIKLDNLDEKNYIDKIKNKYNLEEYLIDIITNNKKEIQKNLDNKKMYNTNLFKDVSDVKEFLNNKSNDEILDMIRSNQNISSKHQAESNRLVISLADLIFVDKDTNDKFWINSAKQLFIGIVGVFLEDYQLGIIDEKQINISSVKKFQNSSLIKENQNYLQKNVNNRKYGSLSKDYLTSILSAADNTYKSITAVFGEKMAIFDDLNVENITSSNEFNFTDIGSKPCVMYIIVPDEDRAYFQLVTIIIGMLTKDLTKFANLSENKGTLPVKVEWILDEFANCPPLSSIETLVSVARSRGMRFQFFIQSFSQLEQVYGKEVASIIIDNAALCYLKTNSVECAEKIMQKLGKSTIETNSMSKSTDPMKVGANQTTSLMGKELLTVTEIIGLKYKTIIFPTVSNPIFRDTYLYSDVYPEFKNVEPLERDIKVLKRITSNYYTVENLRKGYDDINEENIRNTTMNIKKNFERSINRTINQETKKQKSILMNNKPSKQQIPNNIAYRVMQDALYNIKANIIIVDLNTYLIEVDMFLPDNIMENLESFDKEKYMFSVTRNEKDYITKIMIYENTKEKVL